MKRTPAIVAVKVAHWPKLVTFLKACAVKGLPQSPAGLAELTDNQLQSALDLLPEGDTDIIAFKLWGRQEINHKGRTFMKTRLLKTVQDKTTFTDAFMSEIPDLRTHCQRISNQYSEIRLLKQLLMPMTEVLYKSTTPKIGRFV